jgi:hypothetical protein
MISVCIYMKYNTFLLLIGVVTGFKCSIQFTGECVEGYTVNGTANLEVHGSHGSVSCWVETAKIIIHNVPSNSNITHARLTLYSKAIVLIDEHRKEYLCWLNDYDETHLEESMMLFNPMILLAQCPNDIYYI